MTALRSKVVTEFGVKIFARFIEKVRSSTSVTTNHRHWRSRNAAARSPSFVESVLASCLVGDHHANGSIEESLREVKGRMRAVPMQRERRLGFALARSTSCFDSNMLWRRDSRYRRCADGKTPWERDMRRKWSRQSIELGERVFAREARARIRPKQDWEPPLVEVRYADRHARTGLVIGVTSPGVVIGSCPKRPPDSTRWNTDVLLRGLLWKLPLRSRDRPENLAEGAAPALPLQSLQVSKKGQHLTFTCFN